MDLRRGPLLAGATRAKGFGGAGQRAHHFSPAPSANRRRRGPDFAFAFGPGEG